MQRRALLALAAALVIGSSGARAQSGALSGVTMRVLDDLRDVDAVVLELDVDRGESDDGAAAEDRAPGGDDDGDRERRSDAAARAAAAEDTARRAERRERDDLHDVDADERGEGRLEDRDVERSTAPPPAVP